MKSLKNVKVNNLKKSRQQLSIFKLLLFSSFISIAALNTVDAAPVRKFEIKSDFKAPIKFPAKVPVELTLDALRQPLRQRIESLIVQGPQGFKNLDKIAFSKSYTLDERWRSFYVLAKIGGKRALPEIEKALKSDEWFLRAAALTALKKIDNDKAQVWATRFLKSDPALMVRASALDLLSLNPNRKSRELFLEKLKSRDSFVQTKSLWIRPRLVEALANVSRAQDSGEFIGLLDDTDLQVREKAVNALDKINKSSAGNQESLTVRVQNWKNWSRSRSL